MADDGYTIHLFTEAARSLLHVDAFTEQEAYETWLLARAAFHHMDEIYKVARFE